MTSHDVPIHRKTEAGSEDILSCFDTLVSTLEDEIALFRELYVSLQSEHELLVKLSMDELKNNNEARDRLLVKAGSLNDARSAVASNIAACYEMGGNVISLSNLISCADEKHRDRLLECRSVLRSLLHKIIESNEKNMTLINSSVQYTRKSLEFLRDIMAPAPTYGETGLLRNDNPNGRIISRVG